MSEAIPLTPSNRLEEVLAAARAGRVPLADFLAVLLDSDVVLPSTKELSADGAGLTPLIYQKEGTGIVAVFTSLDRAKSASKLARYAITIKTRELLGRMPKEYGLVINPRYMEGLDISPEGIRDITRDF